MSETVNLQNLSVPAGATKSSKRVGRGQGSTWGKTCGKGQKGQKARAGGNIHPSFEGGSLPLQMRIPKRGFTNIFAKKVVVVNLRQLERVFSAGDVVDLKALAEHGLIDARLVGDEYALKGDALKILGQGELTKNLVVKAHRFSKSARAKIEAVGGAVEIID